MAPPAAVRRSMARALGIGAAALLKAVWWDLRLAGLLTHLFVSLFVRTITSERLNLAVRCNVQKSRSSSNVKVKGQGHQGKRRKIA